MARDTLLDFFEDYAHSDDIFLVHDDGYRVRQASYRQVADAAGEFAGRLAAAGVGAGDKVVIWSENRTEWVIALWGCLKAGAVLVPVDFRASADLLGRITHIVQSKVVLMGDEVTAPADVAGMVWKLGEVYPRAEALGLHGESESHLHGESEPRPHGESEPHLHGESEPRPHGASGRQNRTAEPRNRTPEPRNPGTPEPLTGASLAEIIFTSGATADPKGVTITHRNVLANIIPIEREMKKYLRYARPFHPIRFLNLLPLSHMFGQSMATFVPPMLSGTVVFSHGYSPTEILRQIKSRRISVLVCVPKVLDVLREHIERVAPEAKAPDPLAGRHWAWRWWHFRKIHRLFGWKFWCVVCGAAPLDPELEAFWRKLGFLVVQGYGLTETAPIVTLNHPFRASRGTVGTPIGGVEVRIAPDGEILVRGENVTSGYYRPEGAPPMEADAAFKDGWFHTGDIGELDAAGRLLIKGRKKEMIVTPQGLNVFPEDVERALLAQPGVTDAAVVGLKVDGEERIHAVLVLAAGADPDAVVRGANVSLEDHQRVWSTSVWPGAALPRTEGTQKLKRRHIQQWAAGEAPTASSATGTSLPEIVGRYTAGRTLTPDTTLEELGLSSLDRVELMMALEEAFHATLDESLLTGPRTIRELETLLRTDAVPDSDAGAPTTAASASTRLLAETPIKFPAWNRSGFSYFIRRISLPTWILPLGRIFMTINVHGLEHLRDISTPVIFAANHQSHMDTPAILLALPRRWRYRVAPAMAKEFFKAHFNPAAYSRREWFTNSLNYYLSCQFFNAFPLPQREGGTRQTLRYIGEVTSDGYSVLIFPEGKREGTIGRFMPGVAMIAAKLDVPVVPVRIGGLDKVLHPKMKFPKRGPVTVSFGAPLRLAGEDYAGLAKEVEEAVKGLPA